KQQTENENALDSQLQKEAACQLTFRYRTGDHSTVGSRCLAQQPPASIITMFVPSINNRNNAYDPAASAASLRHEPSHSPGTADQISRAAAPAWSVLPDRDGSADRPAGSPWRRQAAGPARF